MADATQTENNDTGSPQCCAWCKDDVTEADARVHGYCSNPKCNGFVIHIPYVLRYRQVQLIITTTMLLKNIVREPAR